ncbi:DJ-1/PfpI family protein [Chitinophaga solisilvae]|uniref:DJ-1/PfpI family protein n=1 Tax=Chitinophaga solisilvae TaxID=1233460 RepID=UPI00136B9D23|nr:DJ-1/PfpI family protein [Chitinophaga solisilvae]
MKSLRSCYVFVYDGYADWEPALTVYGLHSFTDVKVITFSLDGRAVTSGGNITVQPQQSLAQAMEADIDLLLIPGGGTILEEVNQAILPLIRQQLAENKALAAICDATALIAQQGILDHVTHTGNHPEVLKMMAPAYKGSNHYQQTPAATGNNIITASGTAMVAFAHEIYQYFDLLKNEQLSFWLQFFLMTGTGPEIGAVPSYPFFYRTYRITMQELLSLVRVVAREIYQQAIAADLEISGGVEWHYEGFDGTPDKEFTLKIGVPVTAVKAVPAPYTCEVLPVFDCVSTQHTGEWSRLGETYGQLISGIQALGLEMTGLNREQYLRYDFEHPAQNMTNIQIGIKKS